ncbi:uncharacterized protein LOC132311241 [Cornus florida]|uniref:uncharacterized protein LOC132311241 n=1 Tax=Cornus florida TaxID=4283 RepID=UPI00289A49A1|nr:uncharacterized protein LOC132311241 [Cornus florida]
MESLFVRHLICATHHTFPSRCPLIPTRSRRIHTQIRHFRFHLYSKQSDFLDFQGYAKPSRLLPATEVDVYTDSILEKVVTSSKLGASESLFKVKLCTSSMFGSGLSDLNAGILLCLIDENGDSILHRISASSMRDHTMQLEEEVVSDVLHFQRASVDEFTFEGPKLGKIEALWISLESGQWRFGGASLTVVICEFQPPTEANDRKELRHIALQYDFEDDDILLGEGSDISMVELRPSLVTEFSGENFSLLSKNLLQSSSPASYGISNEESMREYENLKSSLLFYDAMLILAGSSIVSFSAGENAAFAFLTGGVVGFLYLLLLQRSVDGLPAPTSTTMNRTVNFNEIFGRLKSPPSLLLALLFAAIAVKYGSGDGAILLTPKEFVSGMAGFLACKVAVVLAALKPMPWSLKENK